MKRGPRRRSPRRSRPRRPRLPSRRTTRSPPQQWYLVAGPRLRLLADPPPTLAPVKVAVVDSGIDGTHPGVRGPDRASRRASSAAARSSTRAGPRHVRRRRDRRGDRTTASGIAGIAFPAQLLIAKVVDADGTIALDGRGGRDPLGRRPRRPRDQPEPRRRPRSRRPEPRHVLAARGRRRSRTRSRRAWSSSPRSATPTRRPTTPWHYASYPAALPHVIGVARWRRTARCRCSPNRDHDLRRPRGAGRRASSRPSRARSPPSGPRAPTRATRTADRTSTAAARAPRSPRRRCRRRRRCCSRPTRRSRPTRSRGCSSARRDDVTPADRLPRVRDRPRPAHAAGAGSTSPTRSRLSQARCRRADVREPNDDAGAQAAHGLGRTATVDATIDYWDDPIDVYRVYVPGGPADRRVGARPVGARREPRPLAARHGARRRHRRSACSRCARRSRRRPDRHRSPTAPR